MPQFASKKRTDLARIKTVFMSEILRETAQRIRNDQNQVVDAWDLFESGALKSMLQGHFSVDAVDEGAKLSLSYLNYFRFLDMPDPRRQARRNKREGYHLYNRISFGNIYNYGIPQIMYGFTKEVHDQMAGALTDAMTNGKSPYQLTNDMLKRIAEQDRNMAAIITNSIRNQRNR